MKYCLLLTVWFCMAGRADEGLIAELNALVETLPASSVYSIQVRDPNTGNVVFQRGAQRNLIPASVLKVLTATLVYDVLGKTFRYSTRFVAQKPVDQRGKLNGEVALLFAGDPSLKREHIDDMVLALKRRGVKWIAGNLWLDEGVFEGYDRAGGVSWDDLNVCFAAPSSAMILDRNCFSGWLKPGRKRGDSATIQYDKPGWLLRIDNRVVTSDRRDCKLRVGPSVDYEYRLEGCIHVKSQARKLAFSVNNVQRAVENYVKASFRRHGIRLQGKVLVGSPKKNLSFVLASHNSTELPELLKPVLERSNNLYSDSLLKTVAYQVSGKPGSFAAGIDLARAQLGGKGVGFGSSRLVDGSGLSRYNAVSAATLVDILMLGWHQWGESSPWLNTRTKKERWYKTGTMSGVSSVAGYAFSEKGEPLVFAIILNGLMPPLPASNKEMRAFRREVRAFHQSFIHTLSNRG